MILSDSSILTAIEKGDIVISPFERKHLNPNSVDLTLGNTIKTYDLTPIYIDEVNGVLDPKKDNNAVLKEYIIPEDGFILMPNHLYLCCTNEVAGTKVYHSQLKGKSSLARLGIFIDCTASWGDTGFVNVWTLEISVVHPVKVYPNMRIAQIIFTEVKGEVLMPYDKKPDSKYNGDNKAKESLYYKNYNQ
jgi:dCTP deaminase